MSYPPPNDLNYQANRPQRTNVLAIVSLVSAFFISLMAVITGHIALGQIKRTGENGRGLALAGVILGYLGLFFGLIGIIIIAGTIGSSSSNTVTPIAPAPPAVTQPGVPSTVPSVTTPVAPEPTAAPQETQAPAEPNLSLGQQNAVDKAQSYLDVLPFSRSGLIKQLKFDGFSTSEADFAVDYLKPNWNEQAEKKAKSYLDVMSFSRSQLLDQLKFDGFTTAQAKHGVSAAGY